MGAAALINHSRALSTSEVGLNFWARGSTRTLVPVRGTNRDQCPPLVPVGATNRDQRPPLPALWAAEKRPLVPVGSSNWD